MTRLDLLDDHIIELLEKDASLSSKALAKQLSVSAATVRRRISRLVQDGVVRIMAFADPSKVGLSLISIIAFSVGHDSVEAVVDRLASFHQVKWISITTGRFDVMAIALFPSTAELSDFLQKDISSIGGVRSSETFICLQVRKGRYVQVKKGGSG